MSERFIVMKKNYSIFLLALLTACGFRPLYAVQDGTTPLAQQVQVENIPERDGQVLRQYIRASLGQGALETAPYKLAVQLENSTNYLGIQKDASSGYARRSVQAVYMLTDTKTGKVVLKDLRRAHSGYTVVASPYATTFAADDAKNKALKALANDISGGVLSYLGKTTQKN
jgi:LPS-assembly lipoprotein